MKNTLILLSVIFITLSACKPAKKPKPNPNIPPKFAEKTEPSFKYEGKLWFLSEQNDTVKQIKIEIADTDAKREKGLMHRRSMADDHGMLFIFDEERRQSFWMRETHIPLDIIFVNANKSIVHIAKDCTPYSLKSIPSVEYAKYVVEVNAGFCNEHNIQTGNTVDFTRL